MMEAIDSMQANLFSKTENGTTSKDRTDPEPESRSELLKNSDGGPQVRTHPRST